MFPSPTPSLDFYLDFQNFLNTAQPLQDDYTLERNADGSYKSNDASPFNGTNGITRLIPNSSGNLLPTIGIIIDL